MVIWILNFGEGLLALNYLIFTTTASLGVIQFVASRGRLLGLMLFPPRVSRWVGLLLLTGSYAWFFAVQPDLFIPGLAGGEFFTLFLLGFLLASTISAALGIIATRLSGLPVTRARRIREPVALGHGAKGELWLPEQPTPALVLALREGGTDSLDHMSGKLVEAGAAVLLCDESAGEAAVQFVAENSDRFHPARRFAIGVGRGADRILQLAEGRAKFRAALALAPFGRKENARPGLRWLRETDLLAAFMATHKQVPAHGSSPSATVRIVYGDEDTLIPPSEARRLFPSALMVAGARHFTLARSTAARRLAVESFELRPSAITAPSRSTAPTSQVSGGLGE